MKELITKLQEEGREKSLLCSHCRGDGYFAEHGNHNIETGECIDCPIQVQCQECNATGRIVPLETVDTLIETAVTEGMRAERERCIETVESCDTIMGTDRHRKPADTGVFRKSVVLEALRDLTPATPQNGEATPNLTK